MSRSKIRQKKNKLSPSLISGKDISEKIKTPADSITKMAKAQTDAIENLAKKRNEAIQDLIKNHPEEVEKILNKQRNTPEKEETTVPSNPPPAAVIASATTEEKKAEDIEKEKEDTSPTKLITGEEDIQTDPKVSLKIISKNLLLVPRMTKEFKLIAKGFGKFLKNETGEKPAKESIISKIAPIKDAIVVRMPDIKSSINGKIKNAKEKTKKFLIEKLIQGLIATALTLVSIVIVNKDLIIRVLEMYGGVEGIMGSAIDSLYSTISDFFSSFNFAETIVDEMSTFTEFLTFGLITKKDAAEVLEKIGSFIKPVTDRIGWFISGIGEWLRDKLVGLGRTLDKDMGVQTKSTKEAHKKELENDPYANAVETIKTLDEDISLLKTRITSLKEFLEKKKQYELEKAQGIVRRETPVPPPAITPTKRVSDKSVFAPKESKPSAGQLATPIKGTASEVPSAQPVTKAAGNLNSITKKANADVDTTGFNPEFQRRIELMATAFKQETGKMLTITSGYRSNEKQKTLWDADLAKNGGKPSGKVAQPMPPLGQGAGSVHIKGLGIDINSKGDAGLNALAGTRDSPTGWLEKFGLIRNVKGEDWHITISGAPSTPDDQTVSDKKGNAVDVATGKIIEGNNIGKSSNEIAKEQREQSKPKNPTIINAGVTNNNIVESNQMSLRTT